MGDPTDLTVIGTLLHGFPVLLLIAVWIYVVRKGRYLMPPMDCWAEQERIEHESREAREDRNRIFSGISERLEK